MKRKILLALFAGATAAFMFGGAALAVGQGPTPDPPGNFGDCVQEGFVDPGNDGPGAFHGPFTGLRGEGVGTGGNIDHLPFDSITTCWDEPD